VHTRMLEAIVTKLNFGCGEQVVHGMQIVLITDFDHHGLAEAWSAECPTHIRRSS
jgi:hypothetical protein